MRAKNATNAVQNSHHEQEQQLFYEARLAPPHTMLFWCRSRSEKGVLILEIPYYYFAGYFLDLRLWFLDDHSKFSNAWNAEPLFCSRFLGLKIQNQTLCSRSLGLKNSMIEILGINFNAAQLYTGAPLTISD